MAWGRAVVGGAGAGAGAGGGGEGNKGGVNGEASASKESRRINVLATGSVDQTIKVGPCFFFFNSYVSSTQGTPDRSGHPSKTLKLLLLYLYIKNVFIDITPPPGGILQQSPLCDMHPI